MALEKLGNGIGYIYITDANNGIIATWQNIKDAVRPFLMEAQVSAPLSNEILSTGSVTITGVTGTASITNITVNGVNILGATVTGTTKALLSTHAVTQINSYISSPDYTAYVSGNGESFIISAKPGTGSIPNGYVVVVSISSGTATSVNFDGGASTSGIYSTAANGRRFYIYADAAAVDGSISGATEVTTSIINRGSQNGQIIQSATLASNVATVARASSFSQLIVDTEGSASTDEMDTISTTGFIDGDILEIRGANSGRVITISSGADNIVLANSVNYITGTTLNSIVLQYVLSTNKWTEIFRTPGLDFSAASIRSQDIAWAAYGSATNALDSAGGTIPLTPGASNGIQFITGTSITLAASWAVTNAGDSLDGDTFHIFYNATVNLNSYNISFFGTHLTSVQALNGALYIRATYNGSAMVWQCTILPVTNGIDFATLVELATKENSLGNPAADGYLLASTAVGSRYWTPSSGSSGGSIVLSAPPYSDVSTPADTATHILKTYTLLANTFSTDESQIVVEARGYFGGDANNKSVVIAFGSQSVGGWTTALNGAQWKLTATITRESANTQHGDTEILTNGAYSTLFTVGNLTQDLTTNIDITVKASNGSAVADDITCSYMSVKIFRK